MTHSYYIRSHAKPEYFWTIDLARKGRVCLTNQPGGAKFIIQRANPLPYDCGPEEDVLADSDEVTITVILEDRREALVINDTDGGYLQLMDNTPAFKFKFGLLTTEGGFVIRPWTIDVQFKSDGYGDEWELVN